MKNIQSHLVRLLSLLAVGVFTCINANAALTVLGVQYQPDQMFPEFDCYWNGGSYPTSCPTNYPGANLHVYVKNTGAGSTTITDATLAGYNLATVIEMNTAEHNLSSIYYYWDNPPSAIIDAGEPVWWKADPTTVPAGGVAQVVVRCRFVPTTATVAVGVVSGAGTVTSNITVDASAPQVQSITYSGDRTKVYLHWRRSGGAGPSSVWMDGTNVTSLTTTVSDPNLNLAASVINLTNALGHFSYHVYQGVYADGKIASASQHAWTNKFIYATYGCFDIAGGYTEADWLNEAGDHGFNNIQMNISPIGAYMNTAGGEADALAQGYGYTIMDPTKLCDFDPDMWFLNDEPDSEESNQAGLNCNTGAHIPCDYHRYPGTLVMYESIQHAATLRAQRPNVPTTVNLDGAEEPYSFYEWGPSVDILQTDNYYEPREKGAYQVNFNRIPLYNNSKLSYGIGRTACAGAEPNPSNHLLYSTRQSDWPYPDYRSKRFEVYYSLAGGSKGMGYWWLNGADGMNNTDPTSQLLWKEVGLCGNEIKTARDLIVRSTPADALGITPGANVWARGVLSGTDSLILYVVNDSYVNASDGKTYVTNVANATVTVTLPSWLLSPMAFEISAGGLKPVSMTATNGNQLQINLGTLVLTRMIVLTKDPQIPLATQNRYVSVVRPGVCNFASAYCTNSAPVIIVPPQSQTVIVNSNATFVVTASGIPAPTYQWRYNGGNLSGATSATYTRTNAQVSHEGSYTVVVSNSLGMVTSAVATLTVSTNGFPPSILAQPQSQTVEQGVNATFTVTADGTAPLTYRWRFNGSTISGATTSSFTRTNTQYVDAGNYDVVITNNAGAITSSVATLTVTAPCVDPGLLNTSFELGNTGGVATNWTGYQRAPNPTTVWTIQTASPPTGGGTQYQQIANTSSTGGGGVRQNITGCTVGATYSVSGWYRGNSANSTVTVRVSPTASTSWATAVDLNPAATMNGSSWITFSGTVVATGTSMTLWLDGQTGGSGQNNTACFDVIVLNCEQMPPPAGPTITQQPSAANVCAGVNTSFSVTATGTGTLTYQWRTNGVNISNGSHYAGCTASTLWVTNVSSSDAVNYSVVVSDANGSTTSANAALTLKTATGFTQHPSATNVCAGVNTTFSVVAVGDGTITYQWQTNGVNISNNSKYGGCTTATLWVTNVSSADAVNYRCVATAGCGSSTSFQGALTLLTATSITGQPSSKSACSGGDVSYSITATGSGTITYQWKTNGVNISNGSHYSGCTSAALTVSNVTSSDVVNYTCTATAACGSATSSSATLTLTAPTLLNPSFELSNISGVATNWTGYQRSPNPTTVWTIQTASPPPGSGLQYQQIANTSSTGGGGVRQDIKNCVIGATYTISGWMRGNSVANATCTVKVSPAASTSWATAVNLSPAATFTGNYWTNFSGTVVATGTNMTLWLDGTTGSTGQNKAECFDGITVTCTP